MAYAESNHDRALRKWFQSDKSCATLHKIKLHGSIRGLKDVEIDFKFPISAFAGKNGCGKTTLLALAACAYHNTDKGFKIKARKRAYHTFSDFLIQTHEEIKPDGITIWYQFLHNNWKGIPPGFGKQKMSKRKGGKWTKYEKRVDKNVVYLGIDRVVPQTERQVYKSYIKYFTDEDDNDWYTDVRKYVGKILDKNYSEFKLKKAGSYNMQLVKETEVVYSGFNMGAGEKALFELFSIIYQCSSSGKASLIIIDEIELGLHEVAQRKLVEVLKQICQQKRLQIVFTTHSPTILNALPLDGRFYIEKSNGETYVNSGISGEFAAGRLSDSHSDELDIYVEDNIGLTLIKSCLTLELRQRVGIIPIGSFSAVCRQLASAYRHPKQKNKSIAIIDGDQRSGLSNLEAKMMQELELSTDVEKSKFKEWVKGRILFLPGTENPEKWIIRTASEGLSREFANTLGVRYNDLKTELDLAITQDIHEELYYLSRKLSLDEESILENLCRLDYLKEQETLKILIKEIKKNLA